MSVFSEENRYVFGVFLVRMWGNTDQKNSEYGHFLRSECSEENDNNDAKNKVKNELQQKAQFKNEFLTFKMIRTKNIEKFFGKTVLK